MTDAGEAQRVEILLAEDNPGDVKLTRKALEQGQVLNNLHVVSDGVEAMTFLRQEGEYDAAPRPDLLLLDLNMPRKDGTAVLEEVKSDPELRRIPVVVLTSSEAEEDVVQSYDLHANAYLTKPVDFAGFLDVVGRVEEFWLSVVQAAPGVMSETTTNLDVLLVEDNPGDAKLVDHYLSDPAVERFVDDVSLTHVETIAAAESELATGRHGVVLLDLGLAASSGLATLDRARSVADGQPIIVLTGTDDHEMAMEAIERGAQDYLPKGNLDGDRLVRALRYAVVRRRQERAVERRRDQLAFFNGVLGHDILNGMNVIRGYSAMLTEELDDEEHDHAETIHTWTEDMIDLTETVRSILGTITDDSDRELEPVALDPVLADIAERARSMSDGASVSVEAEADLAVRADDLLADVLGNLATNAVEHGGDDPSVEITATELDDRVRVRVADDGPGIDDERKDAVFRRDAKGSGSNGSGFGLYFVDSMVDAYDGEVSVTDSDAGGAAFVVELRSP